MKFSVFFLAILLFASCATSRYSAAEIERFKKIANPLERWEAHNIQNYSYEIEEAEAYGTGSHEYKVFVQNSKVEKILEVKTDVWVPSQQIKYYRTIDELISYAQSRMKEDNPEIFEKRVEYDEIYGYPVEFLFDNSNYCSHCYIYYEIYDLEF